MTLGSDVVKYQCFSGPCCLHLQGEVQMEEAKPSKMLVSYHTTTQCQNPEEYDLNLHNCENLKSCFWTWCFIPCCFNLYASSNSPAFEYRKMSPTYKCPYIL